ncbi:MAG: S8 family peptidase [Chloracidobacterium sp.]|uniref:S8 family peptidase n=1 Tax=Chloracidobacterium validum TaxID=2821543 RepID=UPI001FE38BEF|nr:S8 family peptidase [Chloracidobacterium validum]
MKKSLVYAFALLFAGSLTATTFSQINRPLPPSAGGSTGDEYPVDVEGEPRYVANQIIVQYYEDADERSRMQVRALVGASRANTLLSAENRRTLEAGTPLRNGGRAAGEVELDTLPPGLSVKKACEILKDNPAVKSVEPNWIYTKLQAARPNDPLFLNGSLWGMYGFNTGSGTSNQFGSEAAAVWSTSVTNGTGSRNIFIGVIDEGIQVNHPDLQANMWVNPFDPVDGRDNDGNGYVDDTHGWDFANNDRTVYDGPASGSTNVDSHGTHVAGTIGAVGNNGIGVVGVNWRVTMISGKFLGTQGGTTANAIRAIDYFTDLRVRHGLDIVATNNSWGGGGYSQALFDAISRAQARNILFVAAAGNSSNNNDTRPSYPASYSHSHIIAVASITSTGALSSFSNYGRTSVDLGAPGSNIQSTLPASRYGSLSGTSMATPHVTGVVALYAARRSARGLTIKNNIMSSVYRISSLNGRCVSNGTLDANALFRNF